jgi:hypothetical protein
MNRENYSQAMAMSRVLGLVLLSFALLACAWAFDSMESVQNLTKF